MKAQLLQKENNIHHPLKTSLVSDVQHRKVKFLSQVCCGATCELLVSSVS